LGERSLMVEALVQRVTMLATPDGEWVFEGSPEFHAALGDPDPDYDATLFAVKNLGFIKLEMLDQSVIEIEFHPRNVGLSALLAIQQQLQSMKIGLFRLKHFDVAWRSEITFGAEQAMARIADLCAPVHPPPSTDKFLSEKKDYLDLYRSGSSSLRVMAQKWRMSFGHFDSGVLSSGRRAGNRSSVSSGTDSSGWTTNFPSTASARKSRTSPTRNTAPGPPSSTNPSPRRTSPAMTSSPRRSRRTYNNPAPI
jgi:hypothetical protein